MTFLPRTSLVMVLCLIGCGDFATSTEVEDADTLLADRVTELEARLADAEARATDAESRLAAAESATLDLAAASEASDQALDARLTELEVTVSTDDARITDAEARLNEVEGRVAGNEDRLSAAEDATATLADSAASADATLQATIDSLSGTVDDIMIDLTSVSAVLDSEIARVDSDVADANSAIDRLDGALVFVGENDASWGIDLGTSVESGDVTIDDSSVASAGSILLGSGTMYGTSFEVPALSAGVYEVSLSVGWGIGINLESITQRFTLDCSGVELLYAPRVQITAGDASETGTGINVAHPMEVRAWVRATDGDDLACELKKRTLAVARDGSGILYNDLNGPVVARVHLVTPE